MTPFIATYRLQLNGHFTFGDALRVVPYLRELGISHLYLSPIWRARPGSTHGYDVTNPTEISTVLGGDAGLTALARAGVGIVLDVVPNHMAVDQDNPFWTDVNLRHHVFDIDPATGFRRRFFDVDDLAGVRVEDESVFDVTHTKVLELNSRGVIDGIRVDHVDGLANPRQYLERLKAQGIEHIWVEKILESGEELRGWPVEGTTGYDYLNEATQLFVDPSGERALTELAEESEDFAEVAQRAKIEQVETTFARELAELRSLVDLEAVASALALLRVYRTYVEPDVDHVKTADRQALEHLPEPVKSMLMLESPAPDAFVTRFQQTSGPVMAKGVEDTALYRYVRLLALNEVGGDPGQFGLAVSAFHRQNTRRLERFPRSMLTSQTHDTKRSGDVRARLVVLSWKASQWCELTRHWHETQRELRRDGAPDWREELFIYQTLVGAWPMSMDRLGPYLRKALREEKTNSNWVRPDLHWEDRVIDFVEQLRGAEPFLASFVPFATEVGVLGEQIALSQLALRLTSPGLPDLYQGDEMWNYCFVDPDNRRAVDWEALGAQLASLDHGVSRDNAKLFVTKTLLGLRARRLRWFTESYEPVAAADSTCAYRRGDDVVVAVALRDQPIDLDMPTGGWANLLEPLEDLYGPKRLAVFERLDA